MIISIIGARPQFVKAAVLSAEFLKHGVEELIIHTGQHYDYRMSAIFFEELGLPGAKFNLNVGSGSQGVQTAEILIGIEKILMDQISATSHVLVYGDTNSTLAGALAAAKLNIPLVHVEAGLRSYNKTMPEEVNRITTDHLSSLLFCSSEEGVQNLKKEGIHNGVHTSGDIMLDAFNTYSQIAFSRLNIDHILAEHVISNYMLLTIHRPVNTDSLKNLKEIIDAFESVDSNIIWPVHPRNRESLKKLTMPDNVHLYEPFSYFEMMIVLHNCRKVITDSGGLQKEAYWAKKPCVTVRTETEWVETLHNNWNILCSSDKADIIRAINTQVDISTWAPLYGDGNAAEKIVEVIQNYLN